MRSILIIAITAFAAVASAQSQTAEDGLTCFAKLPAPEYPEEALKSHLDGMVRTWVHINQQGVPEKIETQVVPAWSDPNKLLPSAVEKAVRAASIKPECAGKTVSLVVLYEYRGEIPPDPNAAPATSPPNVLLIDSRPSAGDVATTSSRRN